MFFKFFTIYYGIWRKITYYLKDVVISSCFTNVSCKSMFIWHRRNIWRHAAVVKFVCCIFSEINNIDLIHSLLSYFSVLSIGNVCVTSFYLMSTLHEHVTVLLVTVGSNFDDYNKSWTKWYISNEIVSGFR